ncbi:MAG TPA: hypothetical protein VM052_02425 [Candidatus Limnocylindrales bacterium]|nr:hypothetical protein [Candidatus Limnocylindrales bacterium]
MAEYDLVCDTCGKPCDAASAIVSWAGDDAGERAFALTHSEHVPATATHRAEVRRLVWPNEYLLFLTERLGRAIVDPTSLRAIAWGLAPFVMRHDNPTEMDSMRAASFGQRLGVKPGSTDGGVVTADGTPAKANAVEGGK